MKKYILLLLSLSLMPVSALLSQDHFTGSDIPDLSSQTGRPQGVYNEPRWVSWPGTAISFGLAGVAQAGPTLQLDIHLAKGFYLSPSLRLNYLGFASHYLFTFQESDSKYSPASFGVGLGARHFFALNKKNNLAYIGIFGEYSQDKATYNLGSAWESERTRLAVNVLANVGYRWWFTKNLLIQLAVYGGISLEQKDRSKYMLGAYKGDLEKDFKNDPFVGIIDFSIGWNL